MADKKNCEHGAPILFEKKNNDCIGAGHCAVKIGAMEKIETEIVMPDFPAKAEEIKKCIACKIVKNLGKIEKMQ